MSMTTPPGWYPDPSLPAVERWWDGTAWTAHTRPAGAVTQPAAVVVPPKRFGPARIAVAALVVAAVVAGAVLLRPGGDEAPEAGRPPASASAAAPVPAAPATPSAAAEPSAAPSEDGGVLTDQLNGITLPLPKGWEKDRIGVDQAPTMVTTDRYQCPAGTRQCPPGRVTSRSLASAAPTFKAMAEADVAEAAERLYGADTLGHSPYGGVVSHQVVAARETAVAGRTGYLVRWRVTTGKGPGGYVQSLVFPSPGGTEQPVAVRFAFDAVPRGPRPALMDEIVRGIRPIGSSTGGGVGSSIAPPGHG